MNGLPSLSVPKLLTPYSAQDAIKSQFPGCFLDFIFMLGSCTYVIKFVFIPVKLFCIHLIIRAAK